MNISIPEQTTENKKKTKIDIRVKLKTKAREPAAKETTRIVKKQSTRKV